jgi:Spy/CpxP family protein refolding chaperone
MKRTMALVLVGMMAGTIALAQPTGPRGQQKNDRGAKMAATLGLTAEQQSAIDGIRDRERTRLGAIHDQIKAKAVQYAALRDANDPAADGVRAEIKALRDDMQLRRIAMRAEIDDVLTPAQRDQMKTMAKERGRQRHGRRGGSANGVGR